MIVSNEQSLAEIELYFKQTYGPDFQRIKTNVNNALSSFLHIATKEKALKAKLGVWGTLYCMSNLLECFTGFINKKLDEDTGVPLPKVSLKFLTALDISMVNSGLIGMDIEFEFANATSSSAANTQAILYGSTYISAYDSCADRFININTEEFSEKFLSGSGIKLMDSHTSNADSACGTCKKTIGAAVKYFEGDNNWWIID